MTYITSKENWKIAINIFMLLRNFYNIVANAGMTL